MVPGARFELSPDAVYQRGDHAAGCVEKGVARVAVGFTSPLKEIAAANGGFCIFAIPAVGASKS